MPAKKLLIVDDSGFARRSLRRILEESGFEVEEAGGGTEAVDKFSAHKPDAVLLDIVMREIGGLEVLQQLRGIDPHAVVIMATADVQEATRQEALAGGAAGFINKPFKTEEVLAAIAVALGNDMP
ncbi:MAG TPA: response regulator [Verrucomicrobiae bacterium]|nr:response regulator [Verrucomicrobiae bacterium]